MDEADYLPLAVLEKFSFCKRQAYLKHAERLWSDNRQTVEGSLLHRRVAQPSLETRHELRTGRAVLVVCHRLGILGVADVVESRSGQPYPVEYKRGGGRRRRCQMIQLCLQALCLEEMLETTVSAGALYHAGTRFREEISIDADLRSSAEGLVADARTTLALARAPAAVLGRWCTKCSLQEQCLPRVTRGARESASMYLASRIG